MSMKYVKIISLFLIFIACSSPEKELAKSFKNHLTNEQINLIIQINKDYDEFLFEKFPEAENKIDKAYDLLSKTISTQGFYDGYFLSATKLKSIKSKLIETGFYKELYIEYEKEYRINYEGKYLQCILELGKNDKGLSEFHETIVESGQRFNMIMGINAYTYLANKNQFESIEKLLITFELVLWQIETTINQAPTHL